MSMPSAVAAWSSQKRRICIAGILSFSTLCTLAGIVALFSFDQTAGAAGAVPVRWPASSAVERSAHHAALLVFVHPECSCSVATVHEIATLSAGRTSQAERLSPTVLFYRPKNSGWLPGNLWSQVAREIPGAQPVWDDGGQEARRFGARTSGYTLLYGAGGDLLFKGGVTGSRGHQGDNLGMDQLRASIETGRPAAHASLVFGCALTGVDVLPTGEKP
jgi:hypothetical protein